MTRFFTKLLTHLLGPAPDRRSDDSVFDACRGDGE